MELQNTDKQKRDAQLNGRYDENIPIEAKLENADANIKDKGSGQIQALPVQQQNALEKMKELGKASGAAWKSGQESDEAWGLEKVGDAAEQVKAASDKAAYGLKFRVADANAKHR